MAWDRVYLLGYYGPPPGHVSYLSSWDDREDEAVEYVHVVLHGCRVGSVPLWGSPPPSGASYEEMPASAEGGRLKYADERGGLYAFGWRVRVPPPPGSSDPGGR